MMIGKLDVMTQLHRFDFQFKIHYLRQSNAVYAEKLEGVE